MLTVPVVSGKELVMHGPSVLNGPLDRNSGIWEYLHEPLLELGVPVLLNSMATKILCSSLNCKLMVSAIFGSENLSGGEVNKN